MSEKIVNNLLYKDSWNHIISDHVIISLMKVYAHGCTFCVFTVMLILISLCLLAII